MPETKKKKVKNKLENRVIHDYTNKRRCFGHDLTYKPINEGKGLDATGWGHGIKEGHFIILSNPDYPGELTCYRVDKIEYDIRVSDMWYATFTFAPRTKEEKEHDAHLLSLSDPLDPIGRQP